MIEACRSGDADAVEKLLRSSHTPWGDANKFDSQGRSALMWACKHSDERCARLLLEAGADPDHAEMMGGNALMVCASEGRFECVRLLCLHGATLTSRSRSGYTAMDYARLFGYGHIATWLAKQQQSSAAEKAAAATKLQARRRGQLDRQRANTLAIIS